MKTLLLSLIGIAGTTSSSIIPVVAKNHYSMNQIKTSKPEIAEFSYNISTNYTNIVAGQKYNYTKELSNFISEVKDFTASNKVKEWKITQGWSKFGKVEKKDFTADNLEKLNKMLHANKIENIYQYAEIDGPFQAQQWRWYLAGSVKSDEEVFDQLELDAYRYKNPGGALFMEDELNSGFTNTFTIEYIVADKIDISVGNFVESPITEMKYLTTTMDDFKNNMSTLAASTVLKDKDTAVKPEWLSFKEAVSLQTNEQVDQKLLNGELGAGQYNLEVTVVPSTIGIDNNVIGEMTFYMTLKFEYGDLSTLKDWEMGEFTKPNYDNLITIIRTDLNRMGYAKYGMKNAFALSTMGIQLIEITDLYDAETHKKITKEEFDKIPFWKQQNAYTIVYPGENGKKLGILNSTKVYLTITKTTFN